MRNIVLKIEGLSCNHCVSAVTSAVQSLSGISNVEVNLDQKKACIQFDEKQLSTEVIVNAIEKIGFDATIENA